MRPPASGSAPLGAAAALTALGGLHVAWGRGSTFPASARSGLADGSAGSNDSIVPTMREWRAPRRRWTLPRIATRPAPRSGRRLASTESTPPAASATASSIARWTPARSSGWIPRVPSAIIGLVTEGDRKSRDLIGRFSEANHVQLAKRSRRLRLHTQGKHHDLLDIFQQLNERYFGGSMNVLITWGTRSTRNGTKRSTIKLGSYAAQDRLIRLHPALDRRWVPRYFVAHVLFHEMLHHAMPASRGEGRRMLHPPEFRERETEYRFHERALAWERAHLSRLLRA